eukprot:GGOE01025496.1.p3 GENE.GGOE01025496.1~~GGOE01025496.1.p3  ORF type:complete len:271 (+),score=47.09 GGOE01025496.1:33-815(+)
MAPFAAMLPPSGTPQPGSSRPKAAPSVDPDIHVCLDFIKGRCTRPRCKFHHPEMAGYQQLSGAVQAQAGKQICEVWAMTGQCKFGTKCNKVHPIVIAQPTQAVMAIPLQASSQLPLVPNPAAPAVVRAGIPQAPRCSPPRYGPVAPPPPQSPPPRIVPATPLRPGHVVPRSLPETQRPIPTPKLPRSTEDDDAETQFRDLAQSIWTALEASHDEPTLDLPASKLEAVNPTGPCTKKLAVSHPGVDRILLDILSDLNLVPC